MPTRSRFRISPVAASGKPHAGHTPREKEARALGGWPVVRPQALATGARFGPKFEGLLPAMARATGAGHSNLGGAGGNHPGRNQAGELVPADDRHKARSGFSEVDLDARGETVACEMKRDGLASIPPLGCH